jgi:GTPase SAR1 family protein
MTMVGVLRIEQTMRQKCNKWLLLSAGYPNKYSAKPSATTLDDVVRNTFGEQPSNLYGNGYPGYGSDEREVPIDASFGDARDMDDFPPSNYNQQNSAPEFTYNEDDLSQVDKDLIFEGLKDLYCKKVLPLELASKYSHFASPPMGPSDFDAKPMVLILGQYSVGKTSFIRSLLQQDFPGQRIGPEPTTDRFTAIMHTDMTEGGYRHQQPRLLPGHALVMQTAKPFRGLASYGNNFLSKFEGAEVNAPILRNITIVDTPGVLAGEKQRLGRDYDFSEVVKWFAERADMIIVMFDAHKLDISDELRTVLDVLKPHQPKIRVLLNKADTVDTQALLRVYGALMWALGALCGVIVSKARASFELINS